MPIPSQQPTLLVDSPTEAGFATTAWGEAARIRIHQHQVGERFAILDYKAPAHFGPPRHRHEHDDEIIFLQEGTLVVWTPTASRLAGPGDVVVFPRHVPHTWRAYGEAPVRMQVLLTPGEMEGLFEQLVAQQATGEDLAQMGTIAAQWGVQAMGPPLSDEEVAAIVSQAQGGAISSAKSPPLPQ